MSTSLDWYKDRQRAMEQVERGIDRYIVNRLRGMSVGEREDACLRLQYLANTRSVIADDVIEALRETHRLVRKQNR